MDPLPLPALLPSPAAGSDAPPPVTPAAAQAGDAAAVVTVAGRREVGTAPGGRAAQEPATATVASDVVPASATAEHEPGDPPSGLERQPSDPGSQAAQAALRPERTLTQPAPAPLPEVPREEIKGQLGTPRWQQELGQRLLTLTGQGVREVRLQLHPEHLGPLEVRITLHDSQVGLWFAAQHAETRDALEQSLPRLREMFSQGGLTMGDATFAQHHHERGERAATSSESAWDPPVPSSAAQSSEPVRAPVSASQAARLVDEYA
jgi:flagellar hook-length control protein FliK